LVPAFCFHAPYGAVIRYGVAWKSRHRASV
jgi:hypothetical protein